MRGDNPELVGDRHCHPVSGLQTQCNSSREQQTSTRPLDSSLQEHSINYITIIGQQQQQQQQHKYVIICMDFVVVTVATHVITVSRIIDNLVGISQKMQLAAHRESYNLFLGMQEQADTMKMQLDAQRKALDNLLGNTKCGLLPLMRL